MTTSTYSIPLHFGSVQISLTEQQQLFVNLFDTSKDKNYLLEQWKKIWEGIADYEELDDSCKKVMSMTVQRLQDNFEENEWFSYTKNAPHFLHGLPKYAWTKNNFLLTEFHLLNESLKEVQCQLFPIGETKIILEQLEIRKGVTLHELKVICIKEEFDRINSYLQLLGWKVKENYEQFHLYDKANSKYQIFLHIDNEVNAESKHLEYLEFELHTLRSWKQGTFLRLLCLLSLNKQHPEKVEKTSSFLLPLQWISNQSIKINKLKESKNYPQKMTLLLLIITNYLRLIFSNKFKNGKKVGFSFRP